MNDKSLGIFLAVLFGALGGGYPDVGLRAADV
jgi:hypothetical protein